MNKKKSMAALGRMSPEAYEKVGKIPVVVVLDNVRSGHNVGSVFRTSDAFLIDQVILCGITPEPPHRDILKTALGASQTVRWKHMSDPKDAISELTALGYEVWCIEQTDASAELQQWQWNSKPLALVFGNEVKGVSQDLLDMAHGCIEIPQHGTKHSLNVSVCAGIVLHYISTVIVDQQN